MKKITRLMASLLMLVTLMAVFAVVTHGATGESIVGYNGYGYYAYFDFENYGSYGDHQAYMRANGIKNEDGKLCDPFGFVSNLGAVAGEGTIVEEDDGNNYYSFVQSTVTTYDHIAVFTMQSNDSNNVIIGDAAEISFRFRMHSVDTQTAGEGSLLPVLNLRRGSAGGRANHLYTDIYGNLYAQINGASTKVYTNPGDGEFMEISFRWYDVTNTYSLYVNGEPVVEAMPLQNDYRSSTYVSQTYDDDFGVESRALIGSGAEHYRAIELFRRETTSKDFGFDIDDIKLSRIETAHGGAHYYANSFEADIDGVSSRVTRSNSYIFTSATESTLYIGEENGNRFLNVKNGAAFGIKDNYYQKLSEDSYVIEFSVKAEAKHTDERKWLLAFIDNNNVNWIGLIRVGSDGSLYLEDDESTLVEGYKLDGSGWLDFTIVATKDETNSGKFGTLDSNTSSLNTTYSFSCYINKEFVGTTQPIELNEWKIWTSNGTDYSRTTSNKTMEIAQGEGTLSVSDLNLTVVADGVNASDSTENHIIYKNADGSVYYDVEYDQDKTTQLGYSTMTLGTVAGEDTLRFFAGSTFEGAIDNIKIYEGASPEWYECIDSDLSGKVSVVDFSVPAFNRVETDGYTALMSFEKYGANGEARYLDILYADLKTGALAINADGEIYSLCDKDGTPLTLSSGATPITVVYDDINGDVRYFVNRNVAYVNVDGAATPAVDLLIDEGFAALNKVTCERTKLFCGFKTTDNTSVTAASYKLKSYDVNAGDTVKLIGFQENAITDGLRLIAGVDTLYYTSVGFEIESFVGGVPKDIQTVSGTTVYDSIVANDKTFTATKTGYNYLSAAIITDILKSIPENSFIVVRPYAEIEGIRHYDDPAMIMVTGDGYYFVSGNTLYENNFNGLTDLPDRWAKGDKNTSGSSISLKNGEVCLDGYSASLVDYYLDKNLGSNYAVQADFRVIDPANNTRWAGITLRVKDSSTYILVGFRVNGEWFVESHSGGTYQKRAVGSTGIKFCLGQTYKISAVCYGDSVVLFIDGVYVGEATVPAEFTSGGAGVSLGGLTLGVDNFIVRSVTDKYDGKLIYEEDFDGLTDPPAEWGKHVNATTANSALTLSMQDSALRIYDKGASRLVVYNDKELSGNYVFEADLYAEELANTTRYMGLVFGAHDDGTMIAINMRMSDGRIQFESLDDPAANKWTTVATQTKAKSVPALNTFYKFKIVCADGYANFYIDGVEYARFEIPEKYLSGKVGIVLSQCVIHVDNAKIFEISEYEISEEVPATRYEFIDTTVYEENFDGLTAVPAEWEASAATTTPANLTVSVENDALVINDAKSAIVAVTLDQNFSGDFTFEADLTLTWRANDNRYMGLLIGVQEDGSFAGCQMRLSDGRFELTKWDKATNKWTNIGTTISLKGSLSLELNMAYRFKIVCTEGYATAYVNDINCGGFEIPEEHLSGKLGIITSQATVKADNVKVSKFIKYEAIPVYEEDFDHVRIVPEEWSDTAAADASKLEMAADGEALVLKNTTGRSIVALDEAVEGDFMYEAELTLTVKHTSDSWWMGPVFGLQDDGTFVIMDVNIQEGKWYVEPWNGTGWDAALFKATDSSEYITTFKLGVPQKFKLICLGGVGSISINDVEICSFEIPEKYQSGKLGVGFRNSTVTVDNVNVYKLTEYSEYTTLYEADFDGLADVPTEWSKMAATTTPANLTLSVENDALVINDTKSAIVAASIEQTFSGNYTVDADLTMTYRVNTGRYMGVFIGAQDDGAFAGVLLQLSTGRIEFVKWNSTSKWVDLAADTYLDGTSDLSVTHHFTMECVDGYATVYIDNVEYGSFAIPEEHLSGEVGFITSQATVKVDNVKIQGIATQDEESSALSGSADTLADSVLSLGENHVMHNKKLTLSFDVTSLADGEVITLGHGKGSYGGSWIEITDTTLTAYNYLDSAIQSYSAEHGLDISGSVEVVIDTMYGTAIAKIKLADSAFVTDSFAWCGRDGEIFAESEGVTLENLNMNWDSTEYGNNVWIIGDSYLDITANTSWAYYLEKGGLFLLGSHDETSETAIEQFKNALGFGTPEYAVWCVGMNDADSSSAVNSAWQSALDEFLVLCEEKGITPVLSTIPNTPDRIHTFKNSVVTSSGYRYINFAKAVGATANGSAWSTGMLSSDNIHPTAKGAEALYKEVLMDFTEIKENMGGTRIRVATFNTGNFTGAGLARGDEETRLAYVDLLEKTDADLWGFQEDTRYVDGDDRTDDGTITPYDAIYKNVLPNHDGFYTGTYNGKAFLTKFDLYDVEQVYYPAPDTSYSSSVYHYGHRWFLTGKIEVDGKEISVVSLHFDWNCKERRATQIKEVIKFAKEQEYCIIMGDFNPEDYVNSVEISKALFYEEELALFREIGMTHANAGEFGVFDTLVAEDASLYGPWDNIIVSSNINILSAERVYVDWMIDHAIVVAELEIN